MRDIGYLRREKKAAVSSCGREQYTLQDKFRRSRKGFTLAEMLITVAIIGILAAFGFVAVIRYQKSLKQTELDNTAREIFVAAQNHMTVAKASGNWDTYVSDAESSTSASSQLGSAMGAGAGDTAGPSDYDGTLGTWSTEWADGTLAEDEKHDFRYVVTSTDETNDPGILSMILPYDSIDETLRGNGNIVIEYDAKTATVYGVWFCKQTDLKKALGSSTASVTSIADTDAYQNASRKSKSERMKGTPMVGYYGGATSTGSEPEDTEDTLTAIVENDDRLVLQAAVPEQKNTGSNQKAYTIKAAIKGQTSGYTREITLGKSSDTASLGKDALKGVYSKSGTGYRVYYYTLDSVTDGDDWQFAKQFGTGTDALIPGENLTITVTLSNSDSTSNTSDKSDASASVTLNTNSLFANGSAGSDHLAKIVYGRHLQNLSTKISGVNASSSGTNGSDSVVTKAKLIRDLDWSKMTIRFWETDPVERADHVSASSNGEQFSGIVDSALTSFEGNSCTISNLKISAVSSAISSDTGSTVSGLFGYIDEGSSAQSGTGSSSGTGSGTGASNAGNSMTIQNLTLKNPSAAIASYTGFLAGRTDRKTTIQNVSVIGDTTLSLAKAVSGNVSSGTTVTAAGGLVGSAQGNISISAAKISAGSSLAIQADQFAGGILGQADSASTSIQNTTVAAGKTIAISADADQSCAGGILGSQAAQKSGTKGTGTGLSISGCTISVKTTSGSSSGNTTASDSDKYIQISGKYSAAGILGYCASAEPSSSSSGSAYAGSVTVQNCTLYGAGSSDLISARTAAAGLLGYVSTSGPLKVSDSAASMYVADADIQAGQTQKAGFGGLIGYMNSTTSGSSIENCYVGGRTADGQYKDVTTDNTTQGRYNVRGYGYSGGFIGQIGNSSGSLAVTIDNCFSTASAYSGSNANDGNAMSGSFIAYSGTNTLVVKNCYSTGLINGRYFVGGNASSSSQNNYYLAGINNSTLTGANVNKAGTGKNNTPFAKQSQSIETNKYDDSLTGDYPYQMVTGLISYYGDWVTGKEDENPFGLIYYEKHGDSIAYQGYYTSKVSDKTDVLNDMDKNAYKKTEYQYIDSAGNESPVDADQIFPYKQNEYIAEEGYLLLVKETDDIQDIYIGKNSVSQFNTKSTYAQSFNNGNNNIASVFSEYTSMESDFPGYKVYKLDDSKFATDWEYYSNGEGCALIFYYSKNNIQYPVAAFEYLPFFAHEVGAPSTTGGNLPSAGTVRSDGKRYFSIRSGRQLIDFTKEEKNSADGYINKSHSEQYVIEQDADISLDSGDAALCRFNEQIAHDNSEYYSTYTIDKIEAGNTYQGNVYNNTPVLLKGLRTPVFQEVANPQNGPKASLLNLRIDDYDADYFLENNAGIISNLYFTTLKITGGKGLIADSNNGNGSISNVSIENAQISGDGFVNSNAGTINNVTIENAEISGNGFGSLNQWGGTIKNSSIVNAQIGGNGFLYKNDSNSNVSDCQIYADANVYNTYINKYGDNGYYKLNTNTIDNELQNNKELGYNLLICGLQPGADLSTQNLNANTAGFVYINNQGNITNCSYSGKVYGSQNAYGFFGESDGGSITNSYANVILSAADVVAGFGGKTQWKTKIANCHSVGMTLKAKVGAGFLQSNNDVQLTNDYAAIWKNETQNYYMFVLDGNNSLSMSNCGYLSSMTGITNNNPHTYTGLRAYTYSALTKAQGMGSSAIQSTTYPYSQYTNGVIYPFPMPKGMSAYGDWSSTDGYTIEYNANAIASEIKGIMDPSTSIDYFGDFTLPKCRFQRNGYTFVGWNTKADGTGDSYSDTGTVRALAPNGTKVTLYAQWHEINNSWDFSKGEDEAQEFIVPYTGWYKLEVWGAQGGSGLAGNVNDPDVIARKKMLASQGGKGGYSIGYQHFTMGDKIYVYIGGAGEMSSANYIDSNGQPNTITKGGWNGGGNAKAEISNKSHIAFLWGSGGGASHMATTKLADLAAFGTESDKATILLVAGGGGGGGAKDKNNPYNGGAGGGASGLSGEGPSEGIGTGGTQNSGGSGHAKYYVTTIKSNAITDGFAPGKFGAGGGTDDVKVSRFGSLIYGPNGAGGGGGWFGGGMGYTKGAAAGGGSGYVSSGLKNAKMLNGNETITTPSGRNVIGNSGDGYGRITYIPDYNLSVDNTNPSVNDTVTITLTDSQDQAVKDATWKLTDASGNDISSQLTTGTEANVRTVAFSFAGTYTLTVTNPELSEITAAIEINVGNTGNAKSSGFSDADSDLTGSSSQTTSGTSTAGSSSSSSNETESSTDDNASDANSSGSTESDTSSSSSGQTATTNSDSSSGDSTSDTGS